MVLQNRKTDLSYGIGNIVRFREILVELRSNMSYNEFFPTVGQVASEPKAKSGMRHNYRRLFFEIIDNVSGMLQE